MPTIAGFRLGVYIFKDVEIVDFAARLGHRVVGVVPSAITGRDGNQEFFICLRKK